MSLHGRRLLLLNGRRAPSTRSILDTASWRISAAYAGNTAQVFRNLGTLGSAYDAQNGSVRGAVILDGAVLLGDSTNDKVTVPYSADFQPTSSIEVIMSMTAADWSSPGVAAFLFQYGQTSGNYVMDFYRNSGNTNIVIQGSHNGTNKVLRQANLLRTNGVRVWWKIKFTDQGGSVFLQAWDSLDGVDYTLRFSNDMPATMTSIFGSSAEGFEFCSCVQDGLVLHYASVTVDDVLVCEIDPSGEQSGTTSFTDGTGNHTVTVNSTGTDANDVLPITAADVADGGFVQCGGAAGDYLSLASQNLQGDIDLTFEVYLADWGDSALHRLPQQVGASQIGFYAEKTTGNRLALVRSFNGTTTGTLLSDDVSGLSEGWHTCRFTRNATTGAWAWTVDGADYGSGTDTTGNLHASTAVFSFGGAAVPANARLRSLTFSSGGTTRVDIDIDRDADHRDTSFTAGTGGTVTLNDSGSGIGCQCVIKRPTLLLAGANYLTVPGWTPALTDATLVARGWTRDATPGTEMHLISGRTGTSDGPVLAWTTGGAASILWDQSASTPSDTQTGLTDATTHTIIGRRDAGSVLGASVDGTESGTTADSTSGAITCSADIVVGANGAKSGNYFRGLLDEAVIWIDRALTDDEVTAAVAALEAAHP